MSHAGTPLQPQGPSPYVSQFRAHLAEVRAHLAGVVGDDPPPSFIPPTGYWTLSEKNLLFHSLSIYSRFRPDLVSASIGTKSVVDVCAYIDLLDEAIARDSHHLHPRYDIPSAIEVSNAWVLREENMAEDLIPLETCWEKDNLLLVREEEISARKLPQTNVSAIEKRLAVEALETWKRDRRRCWSQEDALSRLECHHLKVMERILKDAESGGADVDETRPEDQETESMGEPPTGGKPSDRNSQSLVGRDETIDPFLHFSEVPVPDRSSHKGSTSQRHTETSRHVEMPRDTLPTLGAASPPQPSLSHPLVAQTLGYSRSSSPDGNRETGIDHLTLSPATRRRLQKRLHMRRKRAVQRGEDVNVTIGKLRPGKKVQKPKASRSREKQPPAELEGDEDVLIEADQNGGRSTLPTSLTPPEEAHQKSEVGDEDGNDNDMSRGGRRNSRGLTKPYKVKRDFETKGIDSDTLINGNLGFFHLSTLSRLMTFYKSGYDDVKGSETATSISADTIRLLSVILVEFVTEVVHQTIALREQENSMKAGIKVYHQTSDDITNENVSHVLDMMGMTGLSTEQYFAQLIGDDIPASTEDEDETDDESGSEHSKEDDDGHDDPTHPEKPTTFPFLLPLHREIHPPLVTLPKSLLPRASARSKSDILADDHLMPTETDEEDLFEELNEEMDIEETDQVFSHEYETNLWNLFGGK